MDIAKLCGLVIPTHMSQKGVKNKDWGPPTPGWVSETLSSLFERVPATQDLETWVVDHWEQTCKHPGLRFAKRMHMKDLALIVARVLDGQR